MGGQGLTQGNAGAGCGISMRRGRGGWGRGLWPSWAGLLESFQGQVRPGPTKFSATFPSSGVWGPPAPGVSGEPRDLVGARQCGLGAEPRLGDRAGPAPRPPSAVPTPLRGRWHFSFIHLAIYCRDGGGRSWARVLGCGDPRGRRATPSVRRPQTLRQPAALSDRETSALHWKVARPSGRRSQLCRCGVTCLMHTVCGREVAEGRPAPRDSRCLPPLLSFLPPAPRNPLAPHRPRPPAPASPPSALTGLRRRGRSSGKAPARPGGATGGSERRAYWARRKPDSSPAARPTEWKPDPAACLYHARPEGASTRHSARAAATSVGGRAMTTKRLRRRGSELSQPAAQAPYICGGAGAGQGGDLRGAGAARRTSGASSGWCGPGLEAQVGPAFGGGRRLLLPTPTCCPVSSPAAVDAAGSGAQAASIAMVWCLLVSEQGPVGQQ